MLQEATGEHLIGAGKAGKGWVVCWCESHRLDGSSVRAVGTHSSLFTEVHAVLPLLILSAFSCSNRSCGLFPLLGCSLLFFLRCGGSSSVSQVPTS